jgi:hypothetical protein
MAAGLPDAASKVVVSTAWAPLPTITGSSPSSITESPQL